MNNVPMFRINNHPTDVEAVRAVIERGSAWAMGPEIKAFEKAICEYTGRRYALAFSSGTTALHASMYACGIGAYDHVIVPAFSFVSVVNAPLFVGANPVFADIETDSLGLMPEDVETVWQRHKDAKAIILMHYGGYFAEAEAVRDVAEEHDLWLIEDACESFGAVRSGSMAGNFGDIGILSFCQNKIITTGEGGAVITDSQDLYDAMEHFRSHGRVEYGDFFSGGEFAYEYMGHNLRMSSMTAALGLSQLGRMPELLENRARLRQRYEQELADVAGVEMLKVPDDVKTACIFFPILFKDMDTRDRVQAFLKKQGISSKVYFKSVTDEPYHSTEVCAYERRLLTNTYETSRRILSLPLFADMTDDEFKDIIEAMHDAI